MVEEGLAGSNGGQSHVRRQEKSGGEEEGLAGSDMKWGREPCEIGGYVLPHSRHPHHRAYLLKRLDAHDMDDVQRDSYELSQVDGPGCGLS